MHLKAIKAHKGRVRGRRIGVGDIYEIGRAQGRALIAAGYAVEAADNLYGTRQIEDAPVTRHEPVAEVPQAAALIEEPAAPVDPFDHDGDGHPGGSPKIEPSEALSALRAEYVEIVGKRPFMGWPADVLAEKIAEARKAAD